MQKIIFTFLLLLIPTTPKAQTDKLEKVENSIESNSSPKNLLIAGNKKQFLSMMNMERDTYQTWGRPFSTILR